MGFQKFQEFVNERMGIPEAAREFTDMIMNEVDKVGFLDSNRPIKIALRNLTHDQMDIAELILRLDWNKPQDQYETTVSGSYNSMDTTIDDVGRITIAIDLTVHPSAERYDEVGLGLPSEEFQQTARQALSKSLLHELTHAYEDYQRRIKGFPGLDRSTTSTTGIFFSNLFKNLSAPPVAETFFFLSYALSDIEIKARVASVYQDIKDLPPGKRRAAIKNTHQYEEAQTALNFNWAEFKREVDKYGGRRSFIELLENIAAELMLDVRQINPTFAENMKKLIKILDKGFDAFYKHYQKFFKENGEKYKRKLLRLASY